MPGGRTVAVVPFVGGLFGIRLARRMPQQLFVRIVIALTVLGAVHLLF